VNRRHTTRIIVGAVLSALLVARAAAQDLPSTTTDGMSLTSEETTTLLHEAKDHLASLGQPADWVDALIADPPYVVFQDDVGENRAKYYPASDTLYLESGLDLTDLSARQMAVIIHELWHAWFDFVPTYLPFFGSAVGKLSDAQDEAVGGFIEELAAGSSLDNAVVRAVEEAMHDERGGTAQDAILAIMIAEEALKGTFFGSRLTDGEVSRWETMRRLTTPEVSQLEQFLSELDVMRIENLADERARLRLQPLPEDPPAETDTGGDSASAAGPPAEAPGSGTAPASGTGGKAEFSLPGFPDVVRTPEPSGPVPIPYPNVAQSSDTARSGRPESPEADEPEADDEPPTVPDPDCDPCNPIAEKLRDALHRQQELQAESDRVNQRLGEITDELSQAQQTRQELQSEFDRRLRETSVRSERGEVRYHEVGDTVYIALGRSADGAFAPRNLPGMPGVTPSNQARPSPYMTRLKERIAAAETDIQELGAEQDQLNGQRKQLDTDLTQAQAAVDQLREELEDCLKRCGRVGSVNTDARLTVASGRTTPGSGSGGRGGSSVSIFVGNPTDLLSGLNLYALRTADGVPYAIARPDHDGDDRYQLFIVTFIRAGRGPGLPPETDPRTGDALHQPRWSPWDRAARSARAWLSGALSLFAPPVHAFAAPRAPLTPGTLVRSGGADQDGAAPTLSLVATGASSGDVLTLEMIDAGGAPVQVVAPDGLVLQAVGPGAVSRGSSAGGSSMATPVTGFCLEYQKLPPPADTVYQVAPEAVQQRYRPMRSILEAGRLLVEAGLLNPDSDPASYATFVQQWALWTKLEDWNEGDFTREFINHTRRNVEDAGQEFTDPMRDALEGAAPNRFNDILTVLVEAEGLVARPPFSLPGL
jgi:hypothetical protein